MSKITRWYDVLTINIYWFALTSRSQVLTPLVIPLLVQRFVGEALKGTYVGRIRLWSLMAAVLIQALMGLLSDRSTSRWGRRRPFIVIGTLGELAVFTLIGFTAGLNGMTGYWALFVLYILSMVSSNTAHAATQGLIPDLVPEGKRGLFSGVKALLELPIPLVFASFVVGRMVSAGNLWGALGALMVVMVFCMLLAMLVREIPLAESPGPFDWKPIVRILMMTGVFTVVILGMGQIVNFGLLAMRDLPGTTLTTILVGAVGLLGMVLAVLVGVWATIAVSMGAAIKTHKSFTWWVTTRLAFLVASTNLAGFMLYFLQERFADLAGEKAAGPASTIIMYVGIFIILTALPSGWLSDRMGKKPLIAASGLIAAIGTAVVVFVPSMTAIIIGGCCIGAAIGFFYSANWALGTEIVPQEQAGQYLGLSNIAGAGAGAIGAYIGGPIADNYGYVLLFSLYGVMFLLSILTLQGVKQKQL
jgi:MFS family permease